MSQLDGLRAFAVAAVLFHHYGTEFLGRPHGPAAYGVKLFFVLSGFLITGILLRASDKIQAGTSTVIGSMRTFYARRTLRIFPLYYFVVLLSCVLAVPPARDLAAWLLTYTLNIKIAKQGWYEDTFAHFWSLCVEEQFYIAWPCLILLAPPRWRVRLVTGVILVSPALRAAYVVSDFSIMTGLATYVSTLMCLDSLGIGALLAILSHRGLSPAHARWLDRIVMPLSLAGILASELLLVGKPWTAGFLFCDTAMAALFAWLVSRAARGFAGIPGRILETAPLLYIGKISYGIYVYHPFVTTILAWAAKKAGLGHIYHGWTGLSLASAASFAVASLSWFAFEKPINDLKRHFAD